MQTHFDVFQFQSSSDLLNAYVSHRKSANRHFSISSWSKKLALPTSGIIVNYLKKRRLPTEDFVARLTESMSLDSQETEYVATLVAAERARAAHSLATPDLERQLETLKFKRQKSVLKEPAIETDLSLAFMAVKVLLENRIPDLTFEQLLRRLRVPVEAERVQEILTRLTGLGIIERSSEGHYRTLVANIETENDFPSEVIRAFHRESLAYATTTLDQVPVDLRHFTSYVMAVEANRLPEAKKAIEDFIDRFVTRFQAGPAAADQVYQLNLNFVPLTDTRQETL